MPTDLTPLERELCGALEAVTGASYPRPVGKSWFPDSRPSKHDQCVHGVWMYETCDGCLDAFVTATLAKAKDRTNG
jgi:hypothetical protein